ncbi:hypothetical protein NQ315_005540 [Exocentrus adspersus]|uniref:ZAD domain-containing protein n=1 Tax=Exocentrus adspersus TaxID=1586481 RepID=A0AAV8VSY3_9CUCU|nr:hypothetical protein NQ315_005540 [Exocentrus adspersus]
MTKRVYEFFTVTGEMNKSRKINLAKVCRTCLSERRHLKEIRTTRIPKMMESCASVRVYEDDGLPGNVCITCFHLIAKFYAFKKNMERSDRILRQYIKNNRIKQSDIINIALSEAEIHETAEGMEGPNDSSLIMINEAKAEFNEDDIPLSTRVIELQEIAKSQLEFIDSKTGDLQEIDFTHSDIEDLKTCDTVQIFTDGPPPLVPLAPVKTHVPVETVVKDLPKDTPPLVPIKPVVNINVLENIIIEKSKHITYNCSTCSKEYDSVSALKDHKANSCQINTLQCNICKKRIQGI